MSFKSSAQLAKNWLAAIVNSSDDVIVSKDLEGTILSWNRAAQRLFGYTEEEAIGQHIGLIIPNDRLDEEYVILGKVRAGESIDHFETVRRRKDGSFVEMSLTVSPIFDDEGAIVGVSKIGKDISQTLIAQKAAAHLAAIVDSSEDAIVSKNLDGIITSWNHGAEVVFGYAPEEAIGKPITLIIPPQFLAEEARIIAKIKAGERLEHFETTRVRKSGELIEVSITVSPVRDAQGKIIGASKIARDITETKKTQAMLAQASRRRDEFMANMSHELRTPMNAIIGLTHVVTQSESLSPKSQRAMGMLRDSAESLLGLINDLLDFAKIDEGEIDIESAEFNLPETVRKVTDLLHLKASEKGVTLSCNVAPAVGDLWIGDRLRIQQILTNLVGNAVKFTDQGQVAVSVGLEEATGAVCFEVRDTGIGIPQDQIEAIFEKFNQGDNSLTRRYGGSGLGLSISKAIVEKLDGRIDVHSRPGAGSVFTVTLPLQRSPKNKPLLSSPAQSTCQFLIVDDYEPNVMILESILDDLGYQYQVAHTGLEAVRACTDTLFDVVLMDVQMPGMDGMEATRRIRQMEGERIGAPALIIGVTAHVRAVDKQTCLDAGMDDFIPKPFEPRSVGSFFKALLPEGAGLSSAPSVIRFSDYQQHKGA